MLTQFKFTTAAPYIGNDAKQVIAERTFYVVICDLVGRQQ
jgi:hypothetical protein